MADGNVEVLFCCAHTLLDPWARFLCVRALFFETIARAIRFAQALSRFGALACDTHKSDGVSRPSLRRYPG